MTESGRVRVLIHVRSKHLEQAEPGPDQSHELHPDLLCVTGRQALEPLSATFQLHLREAGLGTNSQYLLSHAKHSK